jgi:2-keto-3-deoxy-L-rhamnonate aldolase RhmA
MLKTRLANGETLWGSWLQLAHSASAEILAGAGFSWLALDLEHGEAAETDLAAFCRSCRLQNAAPLARVRENDTLAIRRALDLGADGVIVPLVNTVSAARRAVAAATYPPVGERGFAWQAANAYGRNFANYLRDFSPVVIIMIESRQAVENIDDLLAVDGVDGVLVGPYDLSGSYGKPGAVDDPQVIAAMQHVVAACQRRKKAAGQHLVTPTAAAITCARQQGYTFLALGMDTVFLGQGAAAALALADSK